MGWRFQAKISIGEGLANANSRRGSADFSNTCSYPCRVEGPWSRVQSGPMRIELIRGWVKMLLEGLQELGDMDWIGPCCLGQKPHKKLVWFSTTLVTRQIARESEQRQLTVTSGGGVEMRSCD